MPVTNNVSEGIIGDGYPTVRKGTTQHDLTLRGSP